MEKIIDPVAPEKIIAELKDDCLLRHSNKGDNEIYVIDAHNAPNTMREIGRLREIAFRDAGGGTGRSCDIDEFDTMETPCRQLIVWSPSDKMIIGGYRFILGEDVKIENGVPKIATSHMFDFSERFIKDFLPSTIELGRSFVTLEYQSSKKGTKALFALDNLWDGLGALTVVYPQIQYLFGKVTMYPRFGEKSRDLLLAFLHKYFHDNESLVTPRFPLPSKALSEDMQNLFTGKDFKEDYRLLNHAIREEGKNIPPLVNAYMALSPTMRIFGTAVNHEFGEVEESGIFFKIDEIFEDKKKRHIGTFNENTFSTHLQ